MGIRYLWRRIKYFATHQSVQAAYREEAGSNSFCCDDVDSQDFAFYALFSGHFNEQETLKGGGGDLEKLVQTTR